MNLVIVELDRKDATYLPGELLTFHCRVMDREIEPGALEVTVGWYTEGKGDEDRAVIFRNVLQMPKGGLQAVLDGPPCKVQLPNSPLSYHGVLFRIHWCVRVRIKMADGSMRLGEAPFQLGNVAPTQKVSS
jgi:hypothetical protein